MPKIIPKVDACIDWLESTSATTCKDEKTLRRRAAEATKTSETEWYSDKAILRYKMCVRGPGGAQALCGRDDMGTHLIFSGVALTVLKQSGMDGGALLAQTAARGYRPTRIDMALDTINSRIDGLQTFQDFQDGRAETRCKAVTMLSSGDNGWTVYIGSRTSDKHMRVYNKFAEIDNKPLIPVNVEDWIRLEIVCRAHHSRHAAQLITTEGTARAARSLIRDFAFNPVDPGWVATMQGPVTAVGMSVRKITDTRKWLLNISAKVLAREDMSDPTIFKDFIDKYQFWQDWYQKRK